MRIDASFVMVIPKLKSVCFYGNAQIIAMKDQNSLAVEIRRFPRHPIAAWSVLIIAMFGSSLYAQTSEKPKAFLFDEFEKLDDREIDSRTLKLRQKVQERAWTKEPYSVYIVVFKDEKNSSTRPVEK